MRILAVPLLSTFGTSFAAGAPADTVNPNGMVYAIVHCDPKKDVVTIEPGEGFFSLSGNSITLPPLPGFFLHASGDMYPEKVEGSCRWSNGTEVLVHLGTDALSVWVGQAKWVEAAHIFTPPEGSPTGDSVRYDLRTTKITIDRRGLLLCKRGHHFDDDGNADTGDESCVTKPKHDLNSRRDPIEYPTPTTRRPAPFTHRIATAAEPRLCKLLDDFSGKTPWVDELTTFGPNDFVDPLREITFPDYAGPTDQDVDSPWHPFRWDVNNTGKPLWMVRTGSHLGRVIEDTFYAFDDDAFKNISSGSHSDADLIRHATSVFPTDWWTCAHYGRRDPSNSDGGCLGHGLQYVDIDGKQRAYDGGEDVLVPFSYRQHQYFVVRSFSRGYPMSGGPDSIVFVVKPLPLHQYEVTCVFEDVEVNL